LPNREEKNKNKNKSRKTTISQSSPRRRAKPFSKPQNGGKWAILCKGHVVEGNPHKNSLKCQVENDDAVALFLRLMIMLDAF